MKKLLVSCLEPSANLHFKEVLKYLENYELKGIFDPKFGNPYMRSEEFSAMGFVEIVPLIFKAKKAIKEMVKLAKECNHVLLIDSPAFNIPLAKAIKEAGIKTKITYYILPQVWAWKPKRVKKVEAYCDNLASILPFDNQFYTRSIYVGHPLLDEINVFKDKDKHCNQIAFLPGSRRSEIKRLMPIFKECAKSINSKKVLCVPHFYENKVAEIYGDVSEFSIQSGTTGILKNSDFAFICSGTATLESALIGTPFVLCYKAKAIDIFIAKLFVKLKHIGLANIFFDFMGKEQLNDEFIQDEVNTRNLLNSYKNYNLDKFVMASKELREYLQNGSAKNVANLINT
ncbi:lipid-A-disaccharide synthase [Campylobacter sputorum]|uniref:lipid-A-disaccharide synthase n=1 Tax=Campylobacter sputorum TaxID=206 RepID=UPI00053C05A9|nr:lipid-A-disaccharide synthase [Campylobacter sputorum]